VTVNALVTLNNVAGNTALAALEDYSRRAEGAYAEATKLPGRRPRWANAEISKGPLSKEKSSISYYFS
jgi:hypothetical protein